MVRDTRYLLFALLLAVLTGCASTPMYQGSTLQNDAQFERGCENELVDLAGNVLSVPQKLMMWDRRVDNHCISYSTEAQLREYVSNNGITSKVRINQYAPIEEWKRLGQNQKIPMLARCTLGTVHTLAYTLFPGRLFGGDKYNPYTDTLSVYSDIAPLGMVEVAYEKDLRNRSNPGWYAFGQEFPIIGLVHETKATDDVIAYTVATQGAERQREAYQSLYPRYGYSIGGTVGEFVPQGDTAIKLVGGIIGHAVGRKQASQVQDAVYFEDLEQ
jgi:hypothetical protein